MAVPRKPKIYHIVHIDRLTSIISDQYLWCDAKIAERPRRGTTIGMSNIKRRRLELFLASHPGLRVGDCVPFYFCPRSIMLYVIKRANHSDLQYQGGQEFVLHLEADLYASVRWTRFNNYRWAFTTCNAGTHYFEDYKDLQKLGEINWQAVRAKQWSSQPVKESKQAEFLMECCFPWHLIERIGVYSERIHQQVIDTLQYGGHQPRIEVKPEWYY